MKFKKLTRIFKQRVFLVFLVISALLWYFNRLGHRFTTEIDVPIRIVSDFYSDVWIDQPDMKIRVLVEGEGRRLAFYKLGMAEALNIPASELVFVKDVAQDNPYRNFIRPASVKRALTMGINDINFIQINDSLLSVNVSPISRARLPVHSNINIEADRQFMQVGSTMLIPDSVDVKAPQIILDSLRKIETQPRSYKRVRRSLGGNIGLLIPGNVISNVTTVKYSADITSYTEVEYNLPVEIDSLPRGLDAFVVPSSVDLLIMVPLRSYNKYNSLTPVASINYNHRVNNLSSLFEVRIDSLAAGVEIISVTPEFVEAFFTPAKR